MTADGKNDGRAAIRFPQRLRKPALLLIVPTLAVLLMIVLLQRYLIYFPKKEPVILPEDAGLPAGRVKAISTETADGHALNGWLVGAEPGQRDATSKGTQQAGGETRLLLYFSGNAANRLYRVEEATTLNELGADVAIFDYRGYGENTGSPSEEGLAADARAMWRHALEECDVSSCRQIILVGESLGGGVATRLAAELCEAGTPPGGLVLRSTFSSLVDAGAYHYPWLPVRLFLRDRFASLERIPSVTCPILVLHGRQDRIVPFELGQRLFEAAPQMSHNGLAKQFVEFPGADHNDVLWIARNAYREAVGTFLDELGSARLEE